MDIKGVTMTKNLSFMGKVTFWIGFFFFVFSFSSLLGDTDFKEVVPTTSIGLIYFLLGGALLLGSRLFQKSTKKQR